MRSNLQVHSGVASFETLMFEGTMVRLLDSSQRRHAPYPVRPGEVRGLDPWHPAVLEQRPLHNKTVINAFGFGGRILKSGVNNRKTGRRVEVKDWQGAEIYTLTLAERMTCDDDCHMYLKCYGNAMQWPSINRFRPSRTFERMLWAELEALNEKHAKRGFVVRLHILGDFYSTEYAELWMDALQNFPALRIYGYTFRSMRSRKPLSQEIASVIAIMNSKFPDRCNIRTSRPEPGPNGAVVLDYFPETPPEGTFVCAVETDDTTCCGTCGLCWSPRLRDKSVAFIEHGMPANRNTQRIERATC